MKRLLLLLVLLLSSTSFANSAGEKQLFSTSNENTPLLGEVVKLFLGDKMMIQRYGRWLPCYRSNERFEHQAGMLRNNALHIIKEGALFCKTSASSEILEAQDVNVWASGYELKIPLTLKKGKTKSRVCLSSMHCFKKVKNDVFTTLFEQGHFLIVENNSLQQSIEYSGKSGSILTFTYSEYKDSMARDAFTREFKVDLNEGKVAGFKGAIFEIISADNVQITYKVIRHFQ
jgi:hypothetical protein